jgi:hypothetical protein
MRLRNAGGPGLRIFESFATIVRGEYVIGNWGPTSDVSGRSGVIASCLIGIPKRTHLIPPNASSPVFRLRLNQGRMSSMVKRTPDRGSSARNSGYAHPPNAFVRPRARPRDREAHPADNGRSATGSTRLAVTRRCIGWKKEDGLRPSGKARLIAIGNSNITAHGPRQKTIENRRIQMETPDERRCPNYVAG